MLAAHAGSTRSNAAANMTRVEDRNRVPAQPKNHWPESEGTEARASEGLARRVDRALVGVGGSSEQARRFSVERVLEVALAVEEEEAAHHGKSRQADPEADFLDPGVSLHSHRDDDAHESKHDEAGHKDAGLAREEGCDSCPAKRVGQRREELDHEDVGVDGRPEKEREPPSGNG